MGNAASGEKAYSMKLSEKNKLGEGAFGAVYKIKTKDKQTLCAAKVFKIPFKMMSTLEKLGYDREL
jgi:serine/threonine protein kinase